MLESYITFGCNSHSINVPDTVISKAAEKVLKTIERELPQEAHAHAVYNYVLDECKRILSVSELKLE